MKLVSCSRTCYGLWQHFRLGQPRRHLSSRALDLSFTSIVPKNGNETENALVILHGLFGSKRNWGSFMKAFHNDLPGRPIYALDLRNHGSSPHALPMTYEAMAEDVEKFVELRNLRKVTILGHSMGGKVAMAYALAAPNRISRLIVADIAPAIGSMSPEFIEYTNSMMEIEKLPPGKINSRSDADEVLSARGIEKSIRQFLLTNLHIPAKHDDDKVRFVLPVQFLADSMSDLGSFPYRYDNVGSVPVSWSGPTLIVKGTQSPYINHKNIPILRAFFPNARIEELDAGHWVHAEQPTGFRKLVVDFLHEEYVEP